MTRRADPETEAFVEEARGVPILSAYERAGHSSSGLRRSSHEMVGPCPIHGGRRDRLQINERDGVFLCRGDGDGGDAIALYRHLTGDGFLEACEGLLGRDRPRHEDRLSLQEKAKRRREAEARIAEARARSAREAEARMHEAERYRQREWDRCRAVWREAGEFGGSQAAAYLERRAGALGDPAYLRLHPALGYFHDKVRIHCGPAMLALFVMPAAGGWRPIGLHQTWLDLDALPKCRPALFDGDGNKLVTKKMRGSKAGGLLPLAGRYSEARRVVAGEGIETVLAFAGREGFDPDTFYCAAGDLGNLAGKAAEGCRIKHPTLKSTTKRGHKRAVMVPGDEPDFDSSAMPIADHVTALVLLGDGDSDPVTTRLAMRRAKRRHEADGRAIDIIMAPPGTDHADLATTYGDAA